MITSLHNKEVKEVAALVAKKKERDRQGLFVVEGIKMLREAPIDKIVGRIFVAQSAEAQFMRDELWAAMFRTFHYETVSDEVFAKMSDTKTPQGVLCLIEQMHYNIEEMMQDIKGKQPLLIMLEDIQDPGNLGTIFRTAEAAGADGVIMSSKTADIYNPKTIRSTMGSVYRMPFFYVEDLSSIIKRLRSEGVSVYAAHLGGEKAYDAYDYQRGTAFLIGNEANGLREETAACADELIRIPMEGKVESLNAAVASSVLLFEAFRQRRCGKS